MKQAPEPAPPLDAAPADIARRLCGAPAIAGNIDAFDVETRQRVGWALKAECYAAWSSEPPHAVRAASALRALCTAAGDSDPVLLALADWTEGIACLIRSDMADAVGAFDRASARWRAVAEPLHAAHAQVPKIMALAVLGRFDEAADCALETEVALLAEGDEHAAAKVRLNQGSLAYSRDEHAQAVDHYRAAAVRFARAGDREHSVMADVGLGDALSYLGRFDEARHAYTRARLRADAHGLAVLSVAGAHGNALLDLAQGRYREALAGLEVARRAFATLQLTHVLAEAEKSLADAYLEVRLLPEAITLYAQVIASLRAQEALATLPWAQAQLARTQALAGRFEAALATLAEAASGFDTQDNGAGRATVQAVECEVRAMTGHPHEALALAVQAADGFGAAGLEAHRAAALVQAAAARIACGEPAAALAECDALLAEPATPPQVRMRAQVERAAALLSLARRDEARRALEASIDGLEELRAVLPGEDFRRAFLADGSRPYAQRLQLALDDAGADDSAVGAVLEWLERFKARALQERLGRSAPQAPRLPEVERQRQRLNWIYRRQQRRVEDDGESPQALRDEAARLEALLLETARRQRLMAAAPGPAEPPHAALDTARLQRALAPRQALVAYGVAGDELFAVVVRAAGLRLHRRLASWAETIQAVQGLRFQIEALPAFDAVPAAHRPLLQERVRRRLTQLHALVWQPMARELDAHERLIVVPHGALHAVPFAALDDGVAALVDRHELVMAASAGVALRGLLIDTAARAPGTALLLADTTRLSHAGAEMRAVAAALRDARALEGARASVQGLCTAAPAADLLHLACHAQFRADSPLFSALHLADGALTADQVEGLRLRARLVVLSACESALGDAGIADEGVGLVRAFLMAGAERVLGSLWMVGDAVTADFMGYFYRRWCAGEHIAGALRHAQLALRAQQPHPAHWAAFALHGAG